MKKLALLIPVLNEESTISKVIADFKNQFSKINANAEIYVIDNDSEDNTKVKALLSKANVIENRNKGKGNALRYAFSKVKADVYAVVDGDDTYFADDLPRLLAPVLKGNCDMVIGMRMKNFAKEKNALLHKIGNKIINLLTTLVLKNQIHDICSGFRVFSKEVIEKIDLEAKGFEIEAELTIKALKKGFRIKELPIKYKERPDGSVSKLRAFSDGFVILRKILKFSLVPNHKI